MTLSVKKKFFKWQSRLLKTGYNWVKLIKRLNEWKDNAESKVMRVNMNKTKVMISGERQKVRQKAVRWPCGVCSKGVGSNSLQCTCCQKWVHTRNAVLIRVACRKWQSHSFVEAA